MSLREVQELMDTTPEALTEDMSMEMRASKLVPDDGKEDVGDVEAGNE